MGGRRSRPPRAGIQRWRAGRAWSCEGSVGLGLHGWSGIPRAGRGQTTGPGVGFGGRRAQCSPGPVRVPPPPVALSRVLRLPWATDPGGAAHCAARGRRRRGLAGAAGRPERGVGLRGRRGGGVRRRRRCGRLRARPRAQLRARRRAGGVGGVGSHGPRLRAPRRRPGRGLQSETRPRPAWRPGREARSMVTAGRRAHEWHAPCPGSRNPAPRGCRGHTDPPWQSEPHKS